MNLEKSKPETDISELVQKELEKPVEIVEASEQDTVEIRREDLRKEVLDGMQENIGVTKSIKELYEFLYGQEKLIGEFFEMGGVPASVDDVVRNIEKLAQKIDRRENISDEELAILPRQYGLRDHVTKLLQAYMVEKAL